MGYSRKHPRGVREVGMGGVDASEGCKGDNKGCNESVINLSISYYSRMS